MKNMFINAAIDTGKGLVAILLLFLYVAVMVGIAAVIFYFPWISIPVIVLLVAYSIGRDMA